jgi:D-alanyl-D-alanine carboxypeptidase/D-alanyl-D-alanine-endopeptidase (penicillin-binding protein 4)
MPLNVDDRTPIEPDEPLDRRTLLTRIALLFSAVAFGSLGPLELSTASASTKKKSSTTRKKSSTSTKRTTRTPRGKATTKPARDPNENPIDAIIGPNDVLVVVGPDGRRIRNVNPTESFVPASTLKVVTAMTALDRLGPDYRFKTTFRVDDAGRLVIEGGGDPYLVSEELALIASRIAERAPTRGFTGVRVDDSAFAHGLVVPGASDTANPYDAPVGALSANFNTLLVKRTKSGLESGEAQTPLTPTARDVASTWRFRGWARVNLRDTDVTARYTGELIAAMLRQRGVPVGGTVERAVAPSHGLPLFYVHEQSRPLSQVLRECLKTSSNFVANQTFLTMALEAFGAPATFEKGARLVHAHLASRGLADGFSIVEGSGLSRDNQATAEAFLRILDAFEPWIGLLRLHEGSPSKTGTLSGTRTLVGYFDHEKHGHLHYVIYLSGNRSGVRFELVRLFRDYL